jgi:hypothetical protein
VTATNPANSRAAAVVVAEATGVATAVGEVTAAEEVVEARSATSVSISSPVPHEFLANASKAARSVTSLVRALRQVAIATVAAVAVAMAVDVAEEATVPAEAKVVDKPAT